MESAKIDLPLEYWEERKEFLENDRQYFIFGKVRMIKYPKHCSIVFYYKENMSLYYLVNGCINFGAWLQSKGYRTIHNQFNFKD